MAALFGGPSSDEAPPQPVPCFRITVLGPQGSGKTSLINSWVNNICPSAHIPTVERTFYYRMLRVQSPEDPNVLINGLAEIEDELSWPLPEPQRATDAGAGPTTRGAPPFPLLERSASAEGDRPSPEVAEYVSWRGARAPLKPLATAAPRAGVTPTGLAHRRMGFLVVFDAHSKESFEQALRILGCFFPPASGLHTGCLYLVANKIDKDPTGTGYVKIAQRARQRVHELNERWGPAGKGHGEEAVQFVEVSALEFTRVRKLFRDVAHSISEHSGLHGASTSSPWQQAAAGGAVSQGGFAGGLLSLGGFWSRGSK